MEASDRVMFDQKVWEQADLWESESIDTWEVFQNNQANLVEAMCQTIMLPVSVGVDMALGLAAMAEVLIRTKRDLARTEAALAMAREDEARERGLRHEAEAKLEDAREDHFDLEGELEVLREDLEAARRGDL